MSAQAMVPKGKGAVTTGTLAWRIGRAVLLLFFAASVPIRWTLLVAAVPSQSKPMQVYVTISPPEITLHAGEVQDFVATVVGSRDKCVVWSVTEDEGGTVSREGIYTAPKVQGIYHVTARSRSAPNRMAVATVTVLAYYDSPAVLMR